MIYDPLTSPDPGTGLDHVRSYWAATAGAAPPDDGPVPGDLDVEVAIIGGGYTGLSCAYFLARDHGITATVLEANRPGWGCSGRNGGFVRPSIGKLGYQRMIEKWGVDVAKAVYTEAQTAAAELRALIEAEAIACDLQPGYFKVAHRPERLRELEREAALLKTVFGYEPELLDDVTLRQAYLDLPEAQGAILYPSYFGLHPMKLAHGLLRLCREAGARVHGGATVGAVTKDGNHHCLHTPRGTVRAKAVALATNGYTSERLHSCLAGAFMPVLSHIIVTRPLTPEEIDGCNFRTHGMIVDTRRINHYYRLLPDNRILLGSRGAASGSPGAHAAQRDYLQGALEAKLPALSGITVDYDWSGWVCLTADWVPHIHTAADDPSFHYSVGYGGGGVCFAVRAGRLLAANIAGKPMPVTIPTTTTRLRRYPFAAFRGLGRRLALTWLELTDRRE